MARGITMLADPPNAATKRKVAKVMRSGASAQPALATVYSAMPATNGPRRP